MNAHDAGFFLRALGDGTRLRILGVLARRDLTVTQLADLLRCPQPRVSRHLRYLHARGLVEDRSAGNSVVYRLSHPQGDIHRGLLALVDGIAGSIEEMRADGKRME